MEEKERQRFEDIIRLLQLETKFYVTREHNRAEHDMAISISPLKQDEIELLKNEALKLLNIK
jgi:hypothetical protein